MKRLLFTLLFLTVACTIFAQTDTIDKQRLFPSEARNYLQEIGENPNFWRDPADSLRSDLMSLFKHSKEPYDSVALRLSAIDLDGIQVLHETVLVRDSTMIRWLNDSTFVIDSVGWNSDLMIKKDLNITYPVNFSPLVFSEAMLDENGKLDSTLFIPDTIVTLVIDTSALESLGVSMFQYVEGGIIPSLDQAEYRRSVRLSWDSLHVVYTDTISYLVGQEDSPFYRINGKTQLDSLQLAVETLLDYNTIRDSSKVIFTDLYGRETPMWLNSQSNEIHRFWVKNFKNDSITLWVGNRENNKISLLLEDDIDITRLTSEQLNHLPLQLIEPERKLKEIELIESDPEFWEYGLSSALVFSQTYYSNWSKGGGNSLSTLLDINGNATFHNTKAETKWMNTARLKYGNVITGDQGLRKNHDIFELSSQMNKKQWDKVDLSASFYMLNQIAKGYKYFPDDSAVVVSKFLNPASITVGLGIEFKPFKHTTFNLAPLSYKNTFVLDTALIDQTNHGIESNRRSRQELGTQILIINEITPMEDLTISNKIRLFSNYLNNPQNIDVDWEFLLDKKISWFFTIRLNLHLIYDDDIKFTIYDDNNQPVILPDGSEKKGSRAQFKEFIGVSLLFKL
jgi:hypothetical protein